jgi:hypothetical protein
MSISIPYNAHLTNLLDESHGGWHVALPFKGTRNAKEAGMIDNLMRPAGWRAPLDERRLL